MIFGPVIAQRVRDYFVGSRRPDAGQKFPELTRRKVEVLELIARAERNSDIAAQLFLSEKTVRDYVSNVFTKLRVIDRARPSFRPGRPGSGGVSSGQAEPGHDPAARLAEVAEIAFNRIVGPIGSPPLSYAGVGAPARKERRC